MADDNNYFIPHLLYLMITKCGRKSGWCIIEAVQTSSGAAVAHCKDCGCEAPLCARSS